MIYRALPHDSCHCGASQASTNLTLLLPSPETLVVSFELEPGVMPFKR